MISLVVATVDRYEKPKRLFESLVDQTSDNFEVIVADQNKDDKVKSLIDKFDDRLSLERVVTRPGLSRSRNMALDSVEGELVGFPDDDCWYESNLIEKLKQRSKVIDENTGLVGQWKLTAPKGEAKNSDGGISELNRYSVTTKVMSPTLFLPIDLLERVGGFDERLGLGSNTDWKAGEDIDIALRCLEKGGRLLYDNELLVNHPDHRGEASGPEKGNLYGAAMGHLLEAHDFPSWFAYYHFFRSLFGSVFFLLRGNRKKARYYFATFKGKLTGWRDSEQR